MKTVYCRRPGRFCCLSATHVAICTVRVEPVYMMPGHAAARASHARNV